MTHRTELETPEYTFFWKGIFSQWHKTSFTVKGKTYNCCEQWMMAQKAEIFGDTETLEAIMASDSPREQKALGRQVKGFDEITWDMGKLLVVILGNYYRGLEDEEFRKALLATDDRTIVEASPYDRIWGNGFYADESLDHISEWGENLLGDALMRVRDALRKKFPHNNTEPGAPGEGSTT